MKKLLILPLLLAFQIVSAQWNAIGWNPFTLRSTSGDSTFVLSAPSRVDLQKGTASWVPASSGGGASYLVYTALLTQSGTNAPVATVLENTLGGTVTWSYADVGKYTASISGDFDQDKTGFIFTLNAGFADTRVLLSGDAQIMTYDETLTNSDDYLSRQLIEIRVYP